MGIGQWLRRVIGTLTNSDEQRLRTENEQMKAFISNKKLTETLELTKVNDLLRQRNTQLQAEIDSKKNEPLVIEERLDLQNYGFYFPIYGLANSEDYKNRIEEIQGRQKSMIKQGSAATCSGQWTVNNKKSLGTKMVKDNVMMILRCYNNECETAISKVRHNSLEVAKRKIETAFEKLNKNGLVLGISISHGYHSLKIEELMLVFEYQRKKQEEKEEEVDHRERLREAAKIEKEMALLPFGSANASTY